MVFFSFWECEISWVVVGFARCERNETLCFINKQNYYPRSTAYWYHTYILIINIRKIFICVWLNNWHHLIETRYAFLKQRLKLLYNILGLQLRIEFYLSIHGNTKG